MKYLSFIFLITFSLSLKAQILIDDFNSGELDSWIESATELSVEDGALKVECLKLGGPQVYDIFFVNIPALDLSKYRKIKLKMNVPDSTKLAPRLRVELRDINGFDSNKSPVTFTPEVNVGFKEYTLDFSKKFKSNYPSLVDLDSTSIVRLTFYINTNFSFTYSGTFYIDDIILEGAQSPLILDYGDEFNYSTDTVSTWKELGFDASTWNSIDLPASYNTPTVTSNVTETDLDAIFLRKEFYVSDIASFNSLLISVDSDDDAEVFINDKSVVDYKHSDIRERKYVLPIEVLDSGMNVISVIQHQNNDVDNDLFIDLKLEGTKYSTQLVRGPYLQLDNSTGIRLKWRTLSKSTSLVRYGLSPNELNDSVYVSTEDYDHVVDLVGLNPFTKYYYTINSKDEQFTLPDTSHYFVTHPVKGEEGKYEFWVVGDAGRSTNDQRDMMKAYVDYKGDKETHSWLLLGDNAYDHGTENEYQRAMFENMFEDMLINTNIYPTPGNHDLDKHGSVMGGITEAPYFDIFDVPTNGESGGVASNTESYYSWDYGNVHFISLDSYGTSLEENDDMYNWLKNDLQANNQRWTVAYCHHPPHSKGSHDSDDKQDSYGALFKIREIMMPLLEQYGVDLVLTGHSHVYERSYLSNGFYEVSDYLPERNAILYPQSSGYDVPYKKNVVHSSLPNQGTIYAVVGCSGSFSDKADWDDQPKNYLTNDFFHVSEKDYTGSFILNVDSDTLKGSFITNTGDVLDEFFVIKDSTTEMRYVYGVGSVIRGDEPSFIWADLNTKDSIIVKWETKFLSETKFDYGIHLDSMSTIYDNKLSYNHEVKIPLLTEGKTYYAVGYNEHKLMLEKDDQRYFSYAVIGLDDIQEEVNLHVFPNPIADQVSVTLDVKHSDVMSIEVLNMEGVIVATLMKEKSVSTGAFEKVFKVGVDKGIYLLRVNIGNQSIGQQVIIE